MLEGSLWQKTSIRKFLDLVLFWSYYGHYKDIKGKESLTKASKVILISESIMAK